MNKPILRSLINALLAFVYIFCIGLFFRYGADKIPDKVLGPLAPVIFLLLFVMSAAIMAILIFGKPVLMYLDGQKKEALKLLFYTVGWLAVFLFTIILFVLIIK